MESAPADAKTLFTLLPSSVTGIAFENDLHETNEKNVFTYRNYYNGGGVGVADLNGDGKPDIVLTGNETGPHVYLNQGEFHFRDVTAAAGMKDDREHWTTGVAIADVNGDGKLDVYICRAGPLPPEQRGNALWINQGNDASGTPRFKDEAGTYGVAERGFSTQAAFVDIDRDGDLDLFVLDNSPRPVSSFAMQNTRDVRSEYGGAKLFRNDGNGHFTDISAGAGIHGPEIAFGLGLAVADVNRDGWPDIYVSNDFFERDYLYLNNGDGTFTDVAERAFAVMSYASMGVDVADIDHDGWPDIYTTEMLPEDEFRLKMTSVAEGWEEAQTRVRAGFQRQLGRNMLQRNNGDGTFSDVGMMAGVARTDWTWSALVNDLDLDGRSDIFVTNGMPKDITSQDYLSFLGSDRTMRAVTSGLTKSADFLRLTQAMPSTRIPNYAFRNAGGLRFENDAAAWGLATPSFSSGAAYGDLDGDGAPDLVVNNTNMPAFVYRNNARRLHPENRFVAVRLDGALQGADSGNRFAVGARVSVIRAAGDTIAQELQPTRGFQSSMDYTLHFGLGAQSSPADTLLAVRVDWPDGRVSTSTTGANRVVTMRQAAAAPVPRPTPPGNAHFPAPAHPLFVDVTATSPIPFQHHENDFIDFNREWLIPKMVSIEGPALAAGDVNGDGLDDVYVGGAKEQGGRLMLQQRDGRFTSSSDAVFDADAGSEDVGAAFLDANGDGRPDLYVVSGGNDFAAASPALQDRLYLNDGKGKFHKAQGFLPVEANAGSRVVAADYDGDGDVDVFVGGRVIPWKYGVDPASALLRNDGTGHFTDVTDSLAPELRHIGMVTDAVWRDVDGDGRPDLVVVGEWMPIVVFHNAGGGRLTRASVRGLEKSDGWWNRIVAGDFTGDGRVDFIVANLGLNSRYQATVDEPATMYVKDFEGNGVVEQVVSVYQDGKSYPLALRDELLTALPSLRSRFPTYKDYAGKTTQEILTAEELKGAVLKRAYTFATSLLRNNGDGSFTLVPLPADAQAAPIYGIATTSAGGGRLDLLLAGGFDGFRPQIGPLEGSRGVVLRVDGQGRFTPLPERETGFVVPGQARGIVRIRTARGDAYVVARNNEAPLIFRGASSKR